MKLRRPNLNREFRKEKTSIVKDREMYLPRGRKLIPIRIYYIKIHGSGNEIRPTIYSNTFISNSNFLIPDPRHDPLRSPPSSNNSPTLPPLPKTSARSYEEKLPFLSILPFPWILSSQAAGVQVSCRRSVSWRWRELRKNAINERRGSKASLEEFPVEKGDAALRGSRIARSGNDPEIYGCGNGASYVGVRVTTAVPSTDLFSLIQQFLN